MKTCENCKRDNKTYFSETGKKMLLKELWVEIGNTYQKWCQRCRCCYKKDNKVLAKLKV